MQAAELGFWGVARLLFEYGLQRRPQHSLMLEKLAEALTAADDWPAAQDSLLQLSKTGVLSKRGKRLAEKVSEQGHQMPGLDSKESHSASAGSRFKRRRVQQAVADVHSAAPAELALPCSDWMQLLQFLVMRLQMHFAGSRSTTYRFVRSMQGTCTQLDTEATHEGQILPQQQSTVSQVPYGNEQAGRPSSASLLSSGPQEAQQPMEGPASQDGAERASRRLAIRR